MAMRRTLGWAGILLGAILLGACTPVAGFQSDLRTPGPEGLRMPGLTPPAIPSPGLPSTVLPSGTPEATGPTSLPGPRVALCDERGGRVERRRYDSRLVGAWIPVHLYLPPCYAERAEPYPVLFLFHGKPQDERHWQLLGIIDLVEEGLQEGNIPPLILVMPYLPEPLFSGTDGGPGSYEQEFFAALLPFVESDYLVSTDRERRALVGVSRGAVWALEMGLRHPDAFGALAALSPALSLNQAREAYDPIRLAEGLDDTAPRIYLGAGDSDSALMGAKQLRDILRQEGVEYAFSVVPGTHDGTTWKALLPEMLRFVTRDWIPSAKE